MVFPIRLSANLGYLWKDLPLLQRIEQAAKAGFGAIELHAPTALAKDVATLCHDLGLKIISINTPVGNPDNGDFGLAAQPDRVQEFQAAFQETLEWACVTGARYIHVLPGVKPKGDPLLGQICFIDNLRWAADLAQKNNVSLLLEAINGRSKPGYFYHTQEESDAIRRACARENIKLMFDVFHVGVAQGDVLTRLRTYLPYIGHIQIAGVPDRKEPDEGEINFREIFRVLAQSGYEGWVGCEYLPRGDILEGLKRWTTACSVSLGQR